MGTVRLLNVRIQYGLPYLMHWYRRNTTVLTLRDSVTPMFVKLLVRQKAQLTIFVIKGPICVANEALVSAWLSRYTDTLAFIKDFL